VEKNSASEDDFLARERAALGEDADQFATPQDHVAAAGGGDDLLDGGDDTPAEELGQFESSFPSVETQAQNEVRITSWITLGKWDALTWWYC
jgi:hypothetical protein